MAAELTQLSGGEHRQRVVRKISGASADPANFSRERHQETDHHHHRDNHERRRDEGDEGDERADVDNSDGERSLMDGHRTQRHKEHSNGRRPETKDSERYDKYETQQSSSKHRERDNKAGRPRTRNKEQHRRLDTGTSSELSRSLNEASLNGDGEHGNTKRHGTSSTDSELGFSLFPSDETDEKAESKLLDSTSSYREEKSKRPGSKKERHKDATEKPRKVKKGKSTEQHGEATPSPSPRSVPRQRNKSFDDGNKTRRRRKSVHEAEHGGGRRKSMAAHKHSKEQADAEDSDGPAPGTCGKRHTRVIKNTVTQPKLYRTLAKDNLKVFGWTVDMAGTLHSVAKMFKGYTGWVEFAPTSNMRQACVRLRQETVNPEALDKTTVRGEAAEPTAGYLYAFCGTRSERCAAEEGNEACESGQGDWVDQFAMGWLLKQKGLRGLHTSL